MIRRVSALMVLCLSLAVLPGCSWFDTWNGSQSSLNDGKSKIDATVDPSPEGLYAAGVESLKAQRWPQAADYFDQIERDHPYSTWATNAKIMGAYAQYQRNRYTEAIGALDRFIQLHPSNRDIAYAYYLRALSYYEQIADAERDQRGTEVAMAALQDVVNRFPDTAYARDARLKIDLGRDHLAGKEMHIGRYYEHQRLYAAAIGRFRRVVDEYQTTNHVPEALHRLTEIYLTLGLEDEARKTASVLGFNFPGNPWYQDSYALLVAGAKPYEADRPSFVRRAWNSVF